MNYIMFRLITGLEFWVSSAQARSCGLLYLKLSFALRALLTIAVIDTKAAPRQAPADAVLR